MPSLFTILRKQHTQIRALFERIEKTTTRAPARRQELFTQVTTLLVSHAHAEEQVLYNDVKDQKKERPDALEMIEEHRLAEREVRALSTVDPTTDRWTAMMKVLQETSEHHFEEEEEKVFPALERLYAEKQQEEMGERFLKLEKEKMAKFKTA